MANAPNGTVPNGQRVAVNTSTLSTNTTVPENLLNTIRAGLLKINAPNRVEAVLRDELDRAGYVDKIRSRATTLFRSGQAKSYSDAINLIMAEIRAAEDGVNGQSVNGVNGAASPQNGDEPMGRVPPAALEAGRRVLRKELEEIASIDVDDE